MDGGGRQHLHQHNPTGGQEEAKRRLQQALEWPLRYPHTLARFFSPSSSQDEGDGGGKGKKGGALSSTGSGILLYGPPGCAKTTLGAFAFALDLVRVESGSSYHSYL